MINIKKFIDRVSLAENRQTRELVIPLTEARQLRDELSKLLLDLHEKKDAVSPPQTQVPDLEIKIVGGRF